MPPPKKGMNSRLDTVTKNRIYTNVFGSTVIVIKLITASKLVSKPVFKLNRISLLMIESERLNPVRDCWRRKMRDAAMATSPATPKMLTARERLTTFVRFA